MIDVNLLTVGIDDDRTNFIDRYSAMLFYKGGREPQAMTPACDS